MRCRVASVCLLLSACGPGEPSAAAAPGERIDCALDGAASFAPVCRWEQQGERITLYRPDGGFRRILAGAGGIEAADGAERAQVGELGPGLIEIAIGGDRFRLPVTVQ